MVMIIAGVIAGIVFGCITKHISNEKGYEGGFAWGFWLGVIGIIVVACRTDRSQTTGSIGKTSAATSMSSGVRGSGTGIASNGGGWKCVCGTYNSANTPFCSGCRRRREEASLHLYKTCPYCGANNTKTNEKCFACGEFLSETARLQAVNHAEAAQDNTGSLVESLEKLANLHAAGILTDEEFKVKKESILKKM